MRSWSSLARIRACETSRLRAIPRTPRSWPGWTQQGSVGGDKPNQVCRMAASEKLAHAPRRRMPASKNARGRVPSARSDWLQRLIPHERAIPQKQVRPILQHDLTAPARYERVILASHVAHWADAKWHFANVYVPGRQEYVHIVATARLKESPLFLIFNFDSDLPMLLTH